MESSIIYFVLGGIAIAAGIVFIVARKPISAVALRRRDDPWKKPFMLSPAVMVIGGAILVVFGVVAILAGLYPNA
ncbi:hypothetical protein [Herbiconiux sp. L3-i23]|uniref:hypothetical protein n=1 Tax=Herbiconiux sp. L3-i23 TaxID=2905871 RepID=UPI002060EE1A|nr:hypothetical protein [Herbiconiux sp. L3-i23]BDI22327.1 hypothetical protein L3i23_11030 [Herbiconiux sp. L3-i23]